MKGLALLIVILAGSAAQTPAYPFDDYIISIKQHRPTSRITEFAKQCGTGIGALKAVYGIGANSRGVDWKVSHNLPKDVYNLESDYFSTAEIWKLYRVPRVVDLWFTDTESTEGEMFCLDPVGKVQFLTVVQWSLPIEGVDWWEYRRTQRLGANGRWIVEPGYFLSISGKRIASPKLNPDETKDLKQVVNIKTLKEFRFSRQMLR